MDTWPSVQNIGFAGGTNGGLHKYTICLFNQLKRNLSIDCIIHHREQLIESARSLEKVTFPNNKSYWLELMSQPFRTVVQRLGKKIEWNVEGH